MKQQGHRQQHARQLAAEGAERSRRLGHHAGLHHVGGKFQVKLGQAQRLDGAQDGAGQVVDHPVAFDPALDVAAASKALDPDRATCAEAAPLPPYSAWLRYIR